VNSAFGGLQLGRAPNEERAISQVTTPRPGSADGPLLVREVMSHPMPFEQSGIIVYPLDQTAEASCHCLIS
jgi:hypothetical protein